MVNSKWFTVNSIQYYGYHYSINFFFFSSILHNVGRVFLGMRKGVCVCIVVVSKKFQIWTIPNVVGSDFKPEIFYTFRLEKNFTTKSQNYAKNAETNTDYPMVLLTDRQSVACCVHANMFLNSTFSTHFSFMRWRKIIRNWIYSKQCRGSGYGLMWYVLTGKTPSNPYTIWLTVKLHRSLHTRTIVQHDFGNLPLLGRLYLSNAFHPLDDSLLEKHK